MVEHRERLARFGVEYIEAALAAQGRRSAKRRAERALLAAAEVL